MADTGLLPCPFCGGDAQTDFIEGESYLIECYACRAETGIKDSEEDAIAAWNRRATEPSPSTAPVKDHVVREVVNRLRDTALEFHTHGSLRERLARQLDPLLVASRPAEVEDAGADPGGRLGVEHAETRMDAGFQPVVEVTQEVDDEGLPPLPAPDVLNFGVRAYTAEQFRQGQRDAREYQRRVDEKIIARRNETIADLRFNIGELMKVVAPPHDINKDGN